MHFEMFGDDEDQICISNFNDVSNYFLVVILNSLCSRVVSLKGSQNRFPAIWARSLNVRFQCSHLLPNAGALSNIRAK